MIFFNVMFFSTFPNTESNVTDFGFSKTVNKLVGNIEGNITFKF